MFRLILITLALVMPAIAGGPKVTIVIGSKATPLDKLAAEQLSKDFGLLFAAECSVQADVPDDATNVVLIGHPQSNAAIPADAWPKLTAQGHILKSTRQGLIVGGGSPVATLWAAGELSSRFGMRHLLQGDVLPVEKPVFKLDGFDITLEPKLQMRGWSMYNGNATGAESWSRGEHLALLRQLVKLKFTHILMAKHIVAPKALAVDGDTAGRKAFGGAKEFPVIKPGLDLRSDATALGLQVVEAGVVTHGLGARVPSVLPQFSVASLDRQFHFMLKHGASSFFVNANIPGELNAAAYFVSRVSFDDKLGASQSLADLVTPICGEGVAGRMEKGFEFIAQATKLIDANDPELGVPGPDMLLHIYQSKAALPPWVTEVKTLYTNAMSEMYRANTRAREGARPFILYHAKRLEFAMHWLTAIESLYKAHDATVRTESLEAAVESIYNALNAFGDVARDPSDRGAIALLNAYGYHPLQKLLDSGK